MKIKILFTAVLLSIATLSLPAEEEQTLPSPSEQVQEAFRKAVMEGDLDAIEKTLAADANPNLEIRKYWTALLEAVSTGNLEMARLLIAMGADPNLEIEKVKKASEKKKGWTALLEAVSTGNLDMTRLLIAMGANPDQVNKKGWTALLKAVSTGNLEMVRLLIKMDADPDLQIEKLKTKLGKKKNWTALMEAASTGNLEMIQLLIKMDANPNLKNKAGETALEIAERHDNTAIDQFIRDERQKKVSKTISPLEQQFQEDFSKAVKKGNLKMAQSLLERGTDPNLVNRKYRTALLDAVSTGNLEMARLLIRMGAEPNLEVEQLKKKLIKKGYIAALPLESKKIKWTALMEAAATNNLEMVQLLIKMGANIREKDYSGRTALKIAKEHKNTAIAELIEDEMKKKVIERQIERQKEIDKRQKEVAKMILKARDEEEQEIPTDIAKLISEFEY